MEIEAEVDANSRWQKPPCCAVTSQQQEPVLSWRHCLGSTWHTHPEGYPEHPSPQCKPQLTLHLTCPEFAGEAGPGQECRAMMCGYSGAGLLMQDALHCNTGQVTNASCGPAGTPTLQGTHMCQLGHPGRRPARAMVGILVPVFGIRLQCPCLSHACSK